jgi:hypothetical protein
VLHLLFNTHGVPSALMPWLAGCTGKHAKLLLLPWQVYLRQGLVPVQGAFRFVQEAPAAPKTID